MKLNLKKLYSLFLTFYILSTDFKVVMVCAGLGQDENTQAGTGKLVGVPGHVVVPPGDHHDGGLQGKL